MRMIRIGFRTVGLAALICGVTVTCRAGSDGTAANMRCELVRTFGVEGSEAGRMKSPMGVSVAANGDIFVLDDENDCVAAFDRKFHLKFEFGGRGHSDEQFITPVGIAVSPGGAIAVSSGMDRVQVFSPAGMLREDRHLLAPVGRRPARPHGMAFAGEDEIVVAEWATRRIERFDRSGKLLAGFDARDADGGFHPKAVAVSPSGDYLVLDGDRDRVVRFDRQGLFRAAFGSEGSTSDPGRLNQPSGIAVDRCGRIFVANTGNDRVEVFDSSGRFDNTIGRSGSALGELRSPRGVAIAPNGYIVVADTGNHRVQIFRCSVE
jgi:tripartite motif-containing protein 71